VKVNVYLKSANHRRFAHALELFASGVERLGDTVTLSHDDYFSPCDVAVIFGSWKNRNISHHNIKRDIVHKAKRFIVLETPLIGRGPVKEVGEDDWYRIGVGGFLADTGTFHDGAEYGPDRWKIIKSFFGIELSEYHVSDGPILVALQLPGDASLRGASIERWCLGACTAIREISPRPIVVRLPQLPRNWDAAPLRATEMLPDVSFQVGTADNLVPTLKGAKCSVTYSSGLAIDSLIHGCPTIATDSGSFAYELVSNNFEHIENPTYPDREQWVFNLSYCQWHTTEIEAGAPWRHLRPFI